MLQSPTPTAEIAPGSPNSPGNAAWAEEARRQLDAILRLPHGWDSNGADPPDPKRIEAAKSLLERLCVEKDMPRPQIAPTRTGGVQFEWDANGRYFEMDLTDENEASFFFQDSAAGVEDTGVVSIQDGEDKLLAYVRRVILA